MISPGGPGGLGGPFLPHADRVYVLEHARIVWEGDPGRFAEEMGTGYL